jgi:hypothetical protein
MKRLVSLRCRFLRSPISIDPSVGGTASLDATGPDFEYACGRSRDDATAGTRTPNHPKWAIAEGYDDD